jgi:hypothetical protein
VVTRFWKSTSVKPSFRSRANGFEYTTELDEALEVADFVIQAAGGQTRHGIRPGSGVRRDFEVVFRSNPLWSSFHAIGAVVASGG